MSLTAFGRLHPNYGNNHLPGVDVSGWQSPGQLAQALQWAKWAYIKATEATHFFEHDTTAAHVAVCQQHQVPYGFYHFARPVNGNPFGEAQWFAQAINALGGPGPLPPVLDLEAAGGDLNSFALIFLETIEALTGRRPILYSYAGFISSHLSDPKLASYPLWLAHYAAPTVDAWCPPPWSDWLMWQYQSETPEHGHLDLNVAKPHFLGALSQDDGFTDEDRQWLRSVAHKVDRLFVGFGGDARLS